MKEKLTEYTFTLIRTIKFRAEASLENYRLYLKVPILGSYSPHRACMWKAHEKASKSS